MKSIAHRIRRLVAVVCVGLLAYGESALLAQDAQATAPATAAEPEAAPLSPDQLDSLVAPIALYPDPLLAQVLAASTYPLELIQLQQFLAKNKDLKDKALADAVAKQPWDPAIQSMAAVPEAVDRLAKDIQWTTELGDAFLAQGDDVMEAVQRMRGKAEQKGALKSNEQQTVETKTVENKTVIVVQPTNPEVVYVPSYNPTVVYPPPVYPYPPVYYPPYYPGAGLVSFGVGMAMGAAIWGGSCCGCNWGGGGNNNININNNNNFNRNSNRTNNVGSGNRGGGGNWQHNSQHRGGAPYSNKSTASKYGGSSRGESRGGQGGRGSTASASSRAGGAGSRSGGAGPSASSRSAGGAGSRSGGGGASSFSGGGGSRSGGGSSRSGGGGSAFGGGSGGYSGGSARSSSSRGSSSMGSRGGGSRGGGGGRRR